jgi:hypothetical protein
MIRKTWILIAGVILALLLVSGAALAQSGYQLAASVVAGGGGALQNGAYTLSATLGQAEAGQQFSGGIYTLSGGFWHAANQGKDVFLPLLVK